MTIPEPNQTKPVSELTRRSALALGAAAVTAAALSTPAGAGVHGSDLPPRYVLPGDRVFPSGLALDPRTGSVFSGSAADGTLYRGRLTESRLSVWKRGGTDGRNVTAGQAIDRHGRLWVAGGGVPAVWVYDTSNGRLLAKLDTVPGGFANELVITPDGTYVTDSYVPVIYRITVRSGRFTISRWLDLSDSIIEYDGRRVALNGVTAAGPYLLSVHSNQGRLFRIDRRDRSVVEVDLAGLSLPNGDGMLVRGREVLVVQGNLYDDNQEPRINLLAMNADFSAVRRARTITGDLLHPSSIRIVGDQLLVTNSQYNRLVADPPVPPELPFTISVLPLP